MEGKFYTTDEGLVFVIHKRTETSLKTCHLVITYSALDRSADTQAYIGTLAKKALERIE